MSVKKMKKVENWFIMLAAFAAMLACGRNDASSNLNARRDTDVVCSLKDVPKGWVVIEEHHDIKCETGRGNRLIDSFTIAEADGDEWVCLSSPVPAGYKVTDHGHSNSCRENNTLRNKKYIVRK